MKFLNTLLVFIAIVSVLASCQRENIDMENLEVPLIDIDTIYEGTPTTIYVHFVSGCYDFIYPVTAKLEDGTTSETICKADLVQLIENNFVVGYEYPLEILDGNGSVVTINNEEELAEEDCKGGASYYVGVKEYCHCDKLFIIYPVDVIDQDGTTTTVSDYPELLTAYNAWYLNYDPNNDFLDFIYPITCIDIDGTETEVNNANGIIYLVNETCY